MVVSSLSRQAAFFAVLASGLVGAYVAAYRWATLNLSSSYDGFCHQPGEYTRPCTRNGFLASAAADVFFPSQFPGALVYFVYLGLGIWFIVFLFRVGAAIVRRRMARRG
jgi:hypothetical protein